MGRYFPNNWRGDITGKWFCGREGGKWGNVGMGPLAN